MRLVKGWRNQGGKHEQCDEQCAKTAQEGKDAARRAGKRVIGLAGRPVDYRAKRGGGVPQFRKRYIPHSGTGEGHHRNALADWL
ncbi:hypothetical protein [Paraburkholderia sp. J67]|uniref:hypothetical protein n=1 Tax=Paraburkholderia sp. J67 TaxID=2805435 RepID=UPI002ABD9BA5|nr:hypothetical protein [Paraburkholderia sp. J67]